MCCRTGYFGHWMHHPKSHYGKRKKRGGSSFFSGWWNEPPVNVQEFDDHYEIFVYAAGYEKADFKVNIIGDALNISAKKASDEEDEFSWRRREHQQSHFERKFALPDDGDKERVTASYQDGVLTIRLGKLPGHETVRQQVDIN